MQKRSLLLFAFGVLATNPATAATAPAETMPFDLAQNFVRQIGSFEKDRVQAAKDQSANKMDFAACIRNMTMFQMDLNVSATYLKSIRLSDSNMAKAIPPMIGAFISQKSMIVGDIMKECEALIVPDSKVDYAELAKRAPKLTAMSNYADKSLFEASPAMFATLISPRADSKNRANHMLITHAQRDELLKNLVYEFGEELGMTGENVPYYVAIAQLFRDKLNDFKCADDPWEYATLVPGTGVLGTGSSRVSIPISP